MNSEHDRFDEIVRECLGEAEPDASARLHAAAARDQAIRARIEGVEAMLRTLRADDGADPPPDTVRRAQAIFAARTPSPSDAPRPTLLASLARLVHESLAGAPIPGLRGSTRVRHLVFQGDLGEADLRLETSPDGRTRVLGQVDLEHAPGASVELRRTDGSPPLRVDVDAVGIFSASLSPGRYSMCVASGAASMTTPEFEA